MPRKVDPGSIRVGKGLAPEGTVEDSSLRYPERDADPLRVHIHDPSRAHMASSIGIVDANDCYVSDEVEGALQELCGNSGAGRLNGLISGGTFAELVSPNGSGPVALAGISFTLTLVTPTEVLMNGTLFEASGLTVTVPAPAGNYFVYLSTDPTAPTYRTLVCSVAPPPEVETAGGVEDVLFAKIVHDGTDIISWQDGRFFVRNLDRKVLYSSRQGETVDAWSEGCFATLEAFFLWMVEYGDGGTSEEEKGTVIIRGTHNLGSTLEIPTNHLQFIGDGEAVITSKNLVGTPFLVTMEDKTDITFRNISFLCGQNGTNGVSLTGASGCTEIVFEQCSFDAGGNAFDKCVEMTTSIHREILFRDCTFDSAPVGHGIHSVSGVGTISQYGLMVQGCTFNGGGAGTNNWAIELETSAAYVHIQDSTVNAHKEGFSFFGGGDVRVEGCRIRDCNVGILFDQQTRAWVTDNRITLDDTVGTNGIYFTACTHSTIRGNYIEQPRDGVQGSGIHHAGGSTAAPVHVDISGNSVIGFNFPSALSAAIFVKGASHTFAQYSITDNFVDDGVIAARNTKSGVISGNTVLAKSTTADMIRIDGGAKVVVSSNVLNGHQLVGNNVALTGVALYNVEGLVREITVADNNITGASSYGILALAPNNNGPFVDLSFTGNVVDGLGSPTDPALTTITGIYVGVPNDNVTIDRVLIDGNTITRCGHGMQLVGYSAAVPLVNTSVTDNVITHCGVGQANPPPDDPTFIFAGCMGIGFLFAEKMLVEGNLIDHLGAMLDDTGNPVVIVDPIYPTGIYGQNSFQTTISGNSVSELQTANGGQQMAGIALMGGNTAVQTDWVGCIVSGNRLEAGGCEYGIHVGIKNPAAPSPFEVVSITENVITGGKGSLYNVGIYVEATESGSFAGAISGNQCSDFVQQGVYLHGQENAAGDQAQRFGDIQISDNNLHVASSVFGLSTAIQVQGTCNPATGGRLRLVRLDILDNLTCAAQGVLVTTVGGGAAAGLDAIQIDGLRVDGNKITQGVVNSTYLGSQTTGVAFDFGGNPAAYVGTHEGWELALGSGTIIPRMVARITVSNNEVLLWYFDGEDPKSVALSANFREITRIESFVVEGNRFQGWGIAGPSAPANPISYGVVMVQNTSAGPADNTSFIRPSMCNNHVVVPQENSGPDKRCGGIVWDLEGAGILGGTFDNNNITANKNDADEYGYGMLFYMAHDQDDQGLLQDTSFCNNNLLGPMQVGTYQHLVNGVSLSGNTIRANDDSNDLLLTLAVAKGDVCDNVAMDNNVLTDTGGSGLFFLASEDISVGNLSISGNAIEECEGGGISVSLGQEATSTRGGGSGISILDNVLHNIEGDGIRLNTHGRFWLMGLSASRNNMTNVKRQGIKLEVGGDAATLQDIWVSGVMVEHNNMVECGEDDTALPLIEVSTVGNVGTAQLYDVSVSYNTMSACGNELGSTMIFMDFPSSDWERAENIRVDGNNVTDLNQSLITYDRIAGACIDLTLPEFAGVSVCDNMCQFRGFDNAGTDSYGIKVTMEGDLANLLTVSRNTIKDSGFTVAGKSEDRYLIWLRTPTTGDFNASAWKVENNNLDGFAGSPGPQTDYAILIDDFDTTLGTNGDWYDIAVSNNSIKQCKSGVVVQSAGLNDRESQWVGVTIDHNIIHSFKDVAVFFGGDFLIGRGAVLRNFSVSNNRAYASDSRFTNDYGIRVNWGGQAITMDVASQLRLIQVNYNQVYYVSTTDGEYPAGIDVRFGLNANDGGGSSNFQCHGNMVRNASGRGLYMCIWAPASTANAQGEVDSTKFFRDFSVQDNEVYRNSDAEAWDLPPFTAGQSSNISIEFFGMRVDNLYFVNNASRLDRSGPDYHNVFFGTGYGAAPTQLVGSTHRCNNWQIRGNIVTNPEASTTLQTLWGELFGGTVATANPEGRMVVANYYSEANTASEDEWDHTGAGTQGDNWYSALWDDVNDLNKGR